MQTNSKKTEPTRFAVIGNPIAHSKSPEIHLLFADQTGEVIQYKKILAEIGQFKTVVNKFFEAGGMGLNITVPFKTDAFEYVDEHTDYAKHAGAVNTIIRKENDSYLGANTDGIGLLRDIKKTLRLQLLNKRILIVGAGGAVQGIVEPLLVEKPAELIIANRTVSKAQTIADNFNSIGEIIACGLYEIPAKQYDLILHATSAALHNGELSLPTNIIGAHTCCYDLLYSDSDTPFMQLGKKANAAIVVDGFGMLLEQAAEAFYLWHGKRPDTTMAMNYFRPNRQL